MASSEVSPREHQIGVTDTWLGVVGFESHRCQVGFCDGRAVEDAHAVLVQPAGGILRPARSFEPLTQFFPSAVIGLVDTSNRLGFSRFRHLVTACHWFSTFVPFCGLRPGAPVLPIQIRVLGREN
jgi:hypothetical protein